MVPLDHICRVGKEKVFEFCTKVEHSKYYHMQNIYAQIGHAGMVRVTSPILKFLGPGLNIRTGEASHLSFGLQTDSLQYLPVYY